MSSSWTGALGLSLIVCLIASLAAPALAAAPSHGRFGAGTSLRGPGMAIHARGMHVLSSLQLMSFPVVGPLIAAAYAERAIQRFVHPSPTVKPVQGTGFRAFNRSARPSPTGFGGAAGERSLGSAENLTTYLGGKGYDVTDLNSALADARTALAGSNLTAFGSAMGSFRKDLNAKIAAGTLNRTVVQDYYRTLPQASPVNRAPMNRGMGMRISVRNGWQPVR
ncbi:MAG TPA: hypothetical protein VLV30_08620 [Methanomicrobiales archaeon]|nr:hypothetical protein [Methanomicrobiales archaeon]